MSDRANPAPSLGHQPALEGLRGVCVLAVLAFHQRFDWASGGFLGVSTFFTLSGFLITTLLVSAWLRDGRIDLRRFWERRLRRLLPASLLVLAVVAIVGRWTLTDGARDFVTRDLVAALTYVSNIVFAHPHYAYARIFTAPSPLQHYWSLAIEGQFYLVFPLVVVLALRLGAGIRGLASIVGVMSVASALWAARPMELAEAQAYIYYGTASRVVELLVGSLLALWSLGRPAAPERVPRRWVGVIGALAFAAIVAAWVLVDVSTGWLYRGGFAAYGLASTCVLAAALERGSLVQRVLSNSVLCWLGRISYGAYLIHWPLYLLLDPRHTGLPQGVHLALEVGLTLALAAISERFVERRYRQATTASGDARSFARFSAAAVAAMLVVAALSLTLASSPASLVAREIRLLLSRQLFPPAEMGIRLGFYGDSTAITLGRGFRIWIAEEGYGTYMREAQGPGCSLVTVGLRLVQDEWSHTGGPRCKPLPRQRIAQIEKHPIDLAVVLVGPLETATWRRRMKTEPTALGDPALDQRVRSAILQLVDDLSARGAGSCG